MDIDLVRKGDDVMQAIGKIAVAVSTIIFCSLLIFQLASADFSRRVDDKGIVDFKHYETIPEKYSQNLEGEYWEELANPDFPLALIDWQLITNPSSSDKYMDKHVVGKVRNNSEKEFSEVKIEFTVFDEEGNQIAIVFSNLYNFKPGAVWKFEIPVTDDVERAKLKGLYLPAKELETLPKQWKTKTK